MTELDIVCKGIVIIGHDTFDVVCTGTVVIIGGAR